MPRSIAHANPGWLFLGGLVAIAVTAIWLPALAGILAVLAAIAWLVLAPYAPSQVDPPHTGEPTDRHVEAQPFQPGPGLLQTDVPDDPPDAGAQAGRASVGAASRRQADTR